MKAIFSTACDFWFFLSRKRTSPPGCGGQKRTFETKIVLIAQIKQSKRCTITCNLIICIYNIQFPAKKLFIIFAVHISTLWKILWNLLYWKCLRFASKAFFLYLIYGGCATKNFVQRSDWYIFRIKLIIRFNCSFCPPQPGGLVLFSW